ncbi:5-formyltetrahydrofolate cyclo-ligase [Thermaurantiacus sp.]
MDQVARQAQAARQDQAARQAQAARQVLRKHARAARRAHVAGLAVQVRRALEEALAARVRPLLVGGAVVASYAAMASEVDPEPIARDIETLCFPRVTTSGSLSFHLSRADDLSPGRHGILEPSATAPLVTPSLLFVPLLLFDRRGGRLGQGGGHYDRTLRALRSAGPVLAIGLAWDMQEADALPLAPWDERLDFVATPTRLLRCRSDREAAAAKSLGDVR